LLLWHQTVASARRFSVSIEASAATEHHPEPVVPESAQSLLALAASSPSSSVSSSSPCAEKSKLQFSSGPSVPHPAPLCTCAGSLICSPFSAVTVRSPSA
jgi:hypothetical protein